jgi:class 3 adenylate cyclase/predicted ATPase
LTAIHSQIGIAPQAQTGINNARASAERRQMTIMFYDLVGSTSVANALDPEEVRELIGVFHRCVRDEVTRFGGTVARYVGDGGLVYFGYPQAHEDDAARSIYAAIAATEAVSKLSPVGGHKPQMRIGIATGLVVVGDVVGGGDVPERDVVGQAANLAARLQAIAAPNALVICARTKELAGRLFEYEDLGSLQLKGLPAPCRAWRVARASAADSRFQAHVKDGLAALVGRERETEALLRCWRLANRGSGQVVLLSGEAGIGKSRLCEAVVAGLADDPHFRLRYFCSAHHQRFPLYPSIRQLERVAALTRKDSPSEKLKKLEAALSIGERRPESIALLANLLSIPLDQEYPKLPANPMQLRERTLQVLLSQLEVLCRRRPVLAIFEDVHWIDPTSLELLNRTAALVARLPVLLVVTFRPDFKPPSWAESPHVSSIALSPLSSREGAALIEQVAGNATLASGLVDDIIQRADGLPLFLEELTKAVLESQELGARPPDIFVRTPAAQTEVPAALYAPLLARLDNLGPAKQIAQIGAAIGREFSYELLAAAAPMDAEKLQLALQALIDAGLVSQRDFGTSASFIFKHALIQDAAYCTLLRSTRMKLHERLVHVLEHLFPDTAAAQPELLAHHCAAAGLVRRAVDYWLKAGQQALLRSAMAEAIARLRQGLALLAKAEDPAWRNERELAFQIALGKCLIATKGHAAAETGEAFARARHLCGLLPRPPQLVSVLHGQWTHSLLRAELTDARQRAKELLELGESTDDPILKVMGCRASGVTCFPLGDFRGVRTYLERGLQLFDPERRALYAGLTVDDVQIVMLYYSAWAAVYLGETEQGRAQCKTALQLARQLGQPFSLAHVLIASCLIELTLQSFAEAQALLPEIYALAEEHGITYFGAIGTIFDGHCLASQGHANAGIEKMSAGIAALRASGNVLYLPTFLCFLADGHRVAGAADTGLAHIAEAGEITEATQTRCGEAEMHRVKGELLVATGRLEEAEQSFRTAIVVAQRQQARLWQMRAAGSLAALWQRQGRQPSATDILLLPVFDARREGKHSVHIGQQRHGWRG